jgi:hypothetical protein
VKVSSLLVQTNRSSDLVPTTNLKQLTSDLALDLQEVASIETGATIAPRVSRDINVLVIVFIIIIGLFCPC